MVLKSPTKLNLAPESVNALTHGTGVVAGLGGTIHLLQQAWTTPLLIWCGLYGLSLITVYAFSTLSHAIHEPQARRRLRALDQGTIYFLIAGTYTPFAAFYLPRSPWLLAAIWTAAAVGFWSKVIAQHRVEALATWSYILLGWLPALAFVGRFPLPLFFWIAMGGASYTIGTIFLKLDRRAPYFHAVWHLLVMFASLCHYYAVLCVVSGDPIASP